MFGAEHIFDVTDGFLGLYCTFGTFLPWCIAAGIAIARQAPADATVSESRAPSLTPASAIR
jgi:hypothetical protein